jgi:hypothetical protein
MHVIDFNYHPQVAGPASSRSTPRSDVGIEKRTRIIDYPEPAGEANAESGRMRRSRMLERNLK